MQAGTVLATGQAMARTNRWALRLATATLLCCAGCGDDGGASSHGSAGAPVEGSGGAEAENCAVSTYPRSTGLQSGAALVCCDAGDHLLVLQDCGVGQNHGIAPDAPGCARAFEGEANGGSACAQIQCETSWCGSDEASGAEDEPADSPSSEPPANSEEPSGDCGAAGAVSCSRNEYGVTFHNSDGAWVIYTGCYGPSKRGGGELSVGPGYVARVVLNEPTAAGQTTIVDDEQGPGSVNGVLNAPGYGGLGAFGWHHARGSAPFTLGDNQAWNIDGRHCAEDHGGLGVVRAEVIDGPLVTADGVGVLGIDVYFADGWTGTDDPLMRVRYRYRVQAEVVKMWAVATQHCPNGQCGGAEPAFLKEPKFVAAVNGGGYRRVAVLNHEGKLASNGVSGTPYCAWRGTNPVASTGQCDANYRTRARFDYGTTTDSAEGGCGDGAHGCLNVVMRAYPTSAGDDVAVGETGSFWEGSGMGLDAWALAAAEREAVRAQDSPAGGATWACHGGHPSDQRMRRWELIGGPKLDDQYQSASVFFPAWEGGTGAYDCEPLSRRFGPDGESFAVHAQYSINGGFEL